MPTVQLNNNKIDVQIDAGWKEIYVMGDTASEDGEICEVITVGVTHAPRTYPLWSLHLSKGGNNTPMEAYYPVEGKQFTAYRNLVLTGPGADKVLTLKETEGEDRKEVTFKYSPPQPDNN